MSKKKIVRVFEVKAPITEASIAQSASQRPPLLAKIEKLLGLGSGDKPQEPKKEEDEDHNEHGLGLDGESATEEVLGRLFSTPGDSKRVNLFLNDANLKSHYLAKGGPASLAKMVNKGEWKRDGVDGTDVKLQLQKTPELDAADLVNNPAAKWGPNTVLLNVKKGEWDDFTKALLGNDDAAKQAALAKILDHKNYVGVLNTNAMRAANLPNLIDDDAKLKHFDVRKFVKGYPIRAVIDAAREEWDDRAETAPEDQAAELANNVQKVVNKAVRFIYNSIHKGKFKNNINQTKFDEQLRKLMSEDPLVKGNEQLLGLVQKEVMDKVAADRFPVGNLLDGYVHGDAPTPPAAGAEAPEEEEKPVKKGKDFVDVDQLDAQQIADKLAMDKTKAKAVMRALKGYHIDV